MTNLKDLTLPCDSPIGFDFLRNCCPNLERLTYIDCYHVREENYANAKFYLNAKLKILKLQCGNLDFDRFLGMLPTEYLTSRFKKLHVPLIVIVNADGRI